MCVCIRLHLVLPFICKLRLKYFLFDVFHIKDKANKDIITSHCPLSCNDDDYDYDDHDDHDDDDDDDNEKRVLSTIQNKLLCI